jgi:hypothetical protein
MPTVDQCTKSVMLHVTVWTRAYVDAPN